MGVPGVPVPGNVRRCDRGPNDVTLQSNNSAVQGSFLRGSLGTTRRHRLKTSPISSVIHGTSGAVSLVSPRGMS